LANSGGLYRLLFTAYFLLSEDDFDQPVEKFERNDNKIILFGRLIPGVRRLISLPVGLE